MYCKTSPVTEQLQYFILHYINRYVTYKPPQKNPLKPQNCKKMLRESPASNALAVTFKNAEFS